MRKLKFIGDPSDYDWNVELIKNYVYNEDVELNGFMSLKATLEAVKDQDKNDPILSDWQEVTEQEPISIPPLTKREYFAGLAMQGILSNSNLKNNTSTDEVAKIAITCTDSLLKQLENGK